VSDEAHFIAEFRPAWQIAEVFRYPFALFAERRLDRRGNPKLSDVAVLIERYLEDFFYAPLVPNSDPTLDRWPAHKATSRTAWVTRHPLNAGVGATVVEPATPNLGSLA
jgi:hypothetical protein